MAQMNLSHPLVRGTKRFDAIEFVGSLIAGMMLVCGGALAAGYGTAFANLVLGAGQ